MNLTQTHEFRVNGPVGALSMLADGRLLAGPTNHAAAVIDLRSGQVARLGPDGRLPHGQLRVAGDGGPAPLVGVSGCDLVFVDLDGKVVETRKSGFQRAYTTLTSVAVHAGRGLVATGAPDGVLRLHDVAKARNVNLKGPKGTLDAVSFDAEGARVIGRSSATRQVTVWDVATKKAVSTFGPPPFCGIGGAFAFTPSGEHVVGNLQTWDGDPASAARQNLALFSLAAGALERAFVAERYAMSLAFVGAARLALSSGMNLSRHFVEVRSIADGACLALAEVPALQRHVLPLPDGRLATGGDDGVVRLFALDA